MPTLYDNFSQVRQYIDEHIVDADLSTYVSYAYLESKHYLDAVPNDYPTYAAISDMGYITIDDVPTVDLSTYVTKVELSNAGYLTSVPNDYPTYEAINSMGYITMGDVSACGYITSIPNEYITQDELSANAYITINDVPTVDLSSYVSYAYLESKQYIDNTVKELAGPLFISYSTANNAQYTLNAYSHIIAGTQDKTGVSLVATKRKCGGDNGTTYMAAFFTNIDGRSKFAHKSNLSASEVGGEGDDAFMCFNAYGFRIAYSGTEGVSASTEYEILHEGNIGNLGYVTQNELSAMSYITINDVPTPDLSAYVTKVELSNASYATTSYVDNKFVYLIWTGTSAQYAALSDYTTYQIYLIQEA